MWTLGVCAFASVSLVAFSLTGPLSLSGVAAMAAGALGLLLTPLAAFSRRARLGLWCLGWALALVTLFSGADLPELVVHMLAVLTFVLAGTQAPRLGAARA